MKRCKTPELDKMLAVKERSQAISEFLEWLGTTNEPISFCFYDADRDEYMTIPQSTKQLLAEFFGIDLNKCERERQQLLADLRANGR